MTKLSLLDSSFWILTHRRRAPDIALKRFERLLYENLLAINEMARLEILVAYRDPAHATAVSEELGALVLLDLNRSVWDETRRLARRLSSAGLTQGFPDLLIAATAIHYDAVLLHADSDFEVIAQHSDLRTESFLESLDA